MNHENDQVGVLLVNTGTPSELKTESIKDTFQDLSIYGIIAQIVSNNKWR